MLVLMASFVNSVVNDVYSLCLQTADTLVALYYYYSSFKTYYLHTEYMYLCVRVLNLSDLTSNPTIIATCLTAHLPTTPDNFQP